MTRHLTGPRPALATLARTLGTALVAGLALTACTPGDEATPSAPSVPATSAGAAGQDVGAADTAPAPASLSAHPVAVADGPVAVHATPESGSATVDLAAETAFGSRRTFRVVEASGDGAWLKVVVPARSDTDEGWVRAADVEVGAVRHHIAVDLSDRTLVLSEGGAAVLTATVAVGTADNPTPTGRFFVTDKLSGGGGAYGPYAFGISAWSPTLSEFAGGDGQIGLHGTDRPDLLGQAVSHGCIRLPNEVVAELAAILPLGVPVDIRA